MFLLPQDVVKKELEEAFPGITEIELKG